MAKIHQAYRLRGLCQISSKLPAIIRAKPFVGDDHAHQSIRARVLNLAFDEENVKVVCSVVNLFKRCLVPPLIQLSAIM